MNLTVLLFTSHCPRPKNYFFNLHISSEPRDKSFYSNYLLRAICNEPQSNKITTSLRNSPRLRNVDGVLSQAFHNACFYRYTLYITRRLEVESTCDLLSLYVTPAKWYSVTCPTIQVFLYIILYYMIQNV